MSILNHRYRIVVVGGCNIDISATSSAALVTGDSNPGVIRMGLGGVGRNMAENLVRLGQNTSLLTVLGDDSFASMALSQAQAIGMDLSHALQVQGAPSCVYVCVNDSNGEMNVAVNDMQLTKQITPDWLQKQTAVINDAQAVLLDANLSEPAISFLAQNSQAPVFAEAVSAQKAPKLLPSLSHLYALKANRMEIELLTGQKITGNRDLSLAAQTLHRQGVQYVLITLGSEGAYVSDGTEQALAPPLRLPVINTTGCGDAFMAAAVSAILEEADVKSVLYTGLAAAAICAQSESAVSPNVSREQITQILHNFHLMEENR